MISRDSLVRVAALLALTGCAVTPGMPEPPATHPASPQAAEAPLPAPSRTLDTAPAPTPAPAATPRGQAHEHH